MMRFRQSRLEDDFIFGGRRHYYKYVFIDY